MCDQETRENCNFAVFEGFQGKGAARNLKM